MSMFIGILIGLTIGLTVGVLFGSRDRKRRREPRPAEKNTYGHPRSPLQAIRDVLPDAPLGFAWETVIKYDDRGTAFLHLALVNLTNGKNVADTKADLVYCRYGGKTYASEYRDYSNIKDYIFQKDIVGPLLDWATATFNRYANANKSAGYGMDV